MEEMYRTHKEPAWGWIGALLAARKTSASAAPPLSARPTRMLRPRRAACCRRDTASRIDAAPPERFAPFRRPWP